MDYPCYLTAYSVAEFHALTSEVRAGMKRPFIDGTVPASRVLMGYDKIDDFGLSETDNICVALLEPFADVPKHARDLVPLVKTPLLRKLPMSQFEYDMKITQVCSSRLRRIIIANLPHTSASLKLSTYPAW